MNLVNIFYFFFFVPKYIAKVKQEVRLPCMAVGTPSPQLHWKARGKPIPQNQDRIRQLPDGSLQVNGAKKADAGNYTCMVKNKFGHHMVTHELVVNGPPAPPDIMLTSQTINSFTIKLKSKNVLDKTPVHGYTLNYKPANGEWETASIPFGTDEFTLNDLLCGQKYNLYVTAYNS